MHAVRAVPIEIREGIAMSPLGLLFGIIVGLSLGLTGGGGAIFAVPLLVYGLSIPAPDAVGISLAAVGMTSVVGFVHRWLLEEVELPTGLMFAAAGMLGAPLGTWLADAFSDTVLLLAFAGVMLFVAIRLWQQASRSRQAVPAAGCPDPDRQDGPTCRRDPQGRLLLNSRCAVLLLCVGVMTGLLSGLFGVGGGFVIVPALILFSGMSMQRAIGTSLMVISLVSVSGVVSQVWSGRQIPLILTALFVVGGVAGLFAGQFLGRRLSGPVLQKTFAVAIVAVAAFVIVKNLQT